ncbi:MAG: ribonuclease III [Nitrospiria bacterium]
MSQIDLQRLEGIASYHFSRPAYLKQALTHKSFANESTQKGLKDNERLEYLGDAVLDLVISEHLFACLPQANEGDLSKIKSILVNERTLSEVARKLDLGGFIFLGKGEELSMGRNKNSLLANTLEAFIAAVYLDGGLPAAKGLIHRWFHETIENIITHQGSLDFKTDFQEQCQKIFGILPDYRLVKTSGPDHEKTFEIHLMVKGKVFGTGVGKNKKEAEQMAAKEALNRIKGTTK